MYAVCARSSESHRAVWWCCRRRRRRCCRRRSHSLCRRRIASSVIKRAACACGAARVLVPHPADVSSRTVVCSPPLLPVLLLCCVYAPKSTQATTQATHTASRASRITHITHARLRHRTRHTTRRALRLIFIDAIIIISHAVCLLRLSSVARARVHPLL